ncbi:hypothetical protein C2845_PM18G11360 [Panicum miliaceum]|uniref:Uncharacterized protein n=1 Tax=Panicum miliaceum TaxID=4540 RepID=A0A3L6PJL2_PANMI|nr:hypothetical protein C2845_PM18G11360 [Panicum miliaceum]
MSSEFRCLSCHGFNFYWTLVPLPLPYSLLKIKNDRNTSVTCGPPSVRLSLPPPLSRSSFLSFDCRSGLLYALLAGRGGLLASPGGPLRRPQRLPRSLLASRATSSRDPAALSSLLTGRGRSGLALLSPRLPHLLAQRRPPRSAPQAPAGVKWRRSAPLAAARRAPTRDGQVARACSLPCQVARAGCLAPPLPSNFATARSSSTPAAWVAAASACVGVQARSDAVGRQESPSRPALSSSSTCRQLRRTAGRPQRTRRRAADTDEPATEEPRNATSRAHLASSML